MENAKTEKGKKIAYWIFTIWMALGMVSSAVVQLMRVPEEQAMFEHLQYPVYLMTFLGIMKIIGVIVVLMPKFPLLKEWTYSGFFFLMFGALISHIAVGDGFAETFPPVLLLILIGISWYFRPAGRKIVGTNQVG